MDPRVWERFNRLVSDLRLDPWSALEVGITAGHQSLLDLPAISKTGVKMGLDLDPPSPTPPGRTYQKGNAHQMPFQDETFDLVLSNAMLEHDPQFWLSLAEMRRVLKRDGWLILGAPAFDTSGRTLGVHRYPVDCYRFGSDIVPIWLEGCEVGGFELYLDPPRLIAWGRKLS